MAIPEQPRELSHVDDQGQACLFNVHEKSTTRRLAVAEDRVRVSAELAAKIATHAVAKGNL